MVEFFFLLLLWTSKNRMIHKGKKKRICTHTHTHTHTSNEKNIKYFRAFHFRKMESKGGKREKNGEKKKEREKVERCKRLRGGIKTKNADNVRVFGGGGGGSEIPENADILEFFFPGNFFSLPGLYTILTKIYKNSSISAN